MKRSLFVILAVVLAMAWVACGTQGDRVLDKNQEPIINGLLPDEPMHDAVVSLHQRSGDSWYPDIYCSGTLIAPDVVLTAAHCLDGNHPRRVKPISADEVVVYVGDNPINDGYANGSPYIVTEVAVHPGYDKNAITDDIGLLRLASQPPVTPVAALPASQGLTSADEGVVLNFAGFGADENDNYNQKLQIDGVLDHLYSEFQIYYYQNEGGPCFGDSGGPAFIKRGSTPYVAGITSYGDSYCATYGVSTRPDYYDAWINDFIGTVQPDCSEDGYCNPDCADGADPDCSTAPDCSADGYCNPECADGEDPDCDTGPDCSADGYCNPDCAAGEDPDCSTSDPYCGDGYCDGQAWGEDCNTCAADCPAFDHPRFPACCGDGVCGKKEDASNCPVDCN